MKILIVLVLTVLMVPIMFVAWSRWDFSRNRGSEFGYYGEFNRVSNALASIPGVVVRKAWHNLDMTLEEFGFSLSVTGRPVDLAFGEADPIREMSRAKAIAALNTRITMELSITNK